jgi:hypothetical protein
MTAAVLALTLSAGILATCAAPGAAQASGLIAPAAATTLKTLRVDVDGDGRKDKVTVEGLTSTRYRVHVRTAKGRTAHKTVTVKASSGGTDWYGAARLDGAKGYELVMTAGGEEEASWYNVLTWRKGRLVLEAAPKSPAGSGWGIYGNGASFSGYRFFTSKGHRFVDAADLTSLVSGTDGTITRSVWRSGKWRTVSTRTVSMTNEEADTYFGFQNVTFLGRR